MFADIRPRSVGTASQHWPLLAPPQIRRVIQQNCSRLGSPADIRRRHLLRCRQLRNSAERWRSPGPQWRFTLVALAQHCYEHIWALQPLNICNVPVARIQDKWELSKVRSGIWIDTHSSRLSSQQQSHSGTCCAWCSSQQQRETWPITPMFHHAKVVRGSAQHECCFEPSGTSARIHSRCLADSFVQVE